MDLVLHSHPLASYCQKVLVALYEDGTPCEAWLVDLGDASVEQARTQLRSAYAVLEDRMRTRTWAAGDFGLADCAAAPALYYANEVEPFVDGYPGPAAYFARLRGRPSYARVFAESQPYLQNFPR